MANWCFNRMEISGDKEKIIAIKELVKGEDSELDFFKITPNVEDWDCKWNARDVEVDFDESDSTYIYYSFQTPWCPPIMLYKGLCERFPDVEIKVFITEEANLFAGIGYNCDGEFEYDEIEGDTIFDYNFKIESAKDFCKSNDLNPDDYDLEAFVEDDDLVFDVEDYDFENHFSDIVLTMWDEDDALNILEKYKNE